MQAIPGCLNSADSRHRFENFEAAAYMTRSSDSTVEVIFSLARICIAKRIFLLPSDRLQL